MRDDTNVTNKMHLLFYSITLWFKINVFKYFT